MNLLPIIFAVFVQGTGGNGEGNCASVALIKASIVTFGIDSVFEEVWKGDTAFITLKSNERLMLSRSEVEYAAAAARFSTKPSRCDSSDFEQKDRLRKYAHLCFAVICKMVQIQYEQDGKCLTFSETVADVNDGLYTPNVYRYLGLTDFVRHSRRGLFGIPALRIINSRNKNGLVGVAWRSKHAVFISNGHYDLYGCKRKITPRYYGSFYLDPSSN